MFEGTPVGGRELAGATGQAAGWKGRETEAPGVGNGVFGHDFKSLSVVFEPSGETCQYFESGV